MIAPMNHRTPSQSATGVSGFAPEVSGSVAQQSHIVKYPELPARSPVSRRHDVGSRANLGDPQTWAQYAPEATLVVAVAVGIFIGWMVKRK